MSGAATIVAGVSAAAEVGSLAYGMAQGSPKAPSVPPPPPAAAPASLASAATGAAGAAGGAAARIRGAVGAGFDGTAGSNPLGFPGASTSKETLGG